MNIKIILWMNKCNTYSEKNYVWFWFKVLSDSLKAKTFKRKLVYKLK